MTVAGTDAALGTLLSSVIVTPPAGAEPVRVAVPVEEPPPWIAAGFKVSELSAIGGVVSKTMSTQ